MTQAREVPPAGPSFREEEGAARDRRSLECLCQVTRRIRVGLGETELLGEFLLLLHEILPFDLGGVIHQGAERAHLVVLPAAACDAGCGASFRTLLVEEARGAGLLVGAGALLDERRLAELDPSRRMVGDRPASRISVPLRASSGRAFGRLVLVSFDGDLYERGDTRLLSSLVDHVSLVLEVDELGRRVERAAQQDELTGLPNQGAFRRRLERELARSERYRSDLSLLLVDVDHFRAFNEVAGRERGDELLVRLGALLDTERRSVDRVARLGGDLFAVLLPETRREGALQMAERLRNAAAAALGGDGRRITVSVGVTTNRGGQGSEGEAFLRRARRALTRGKELGRDRVELA